MPSHSPGNSSSFRDPIGNVVVVEKRIFRLIKKPFGNQITRFIESAFFNQCRESGQFPATALFQDTQDILKEISSRLQPECVLEHQRIPFAIYPHEWTPNMLFDAGQLTLDMAEDALKNGWMMKDATPWNVLYSDGKPVFCDILSFEPRTGTRIWNAYAQFQRTFVLPLYAHEKLAWPVHAIFITQRDGIDPSSLAPVIKGFRRWAPLELQTIILPAKLSQSQIGQNEPKLQKRSLEQETDNQQLADFVMLRSLNRLRKQLNAVRPRRENTSQWSHYENDLQHYTDVDHEAKRNFVSRILTELGNGRVLDIGANSGEYSLLAAKLGASVVATDFDVTALDKLYTRVKAEELPITPAVLNIARPTPAVGWANNEVDSFLSRAKGEFNTVMMLAVLHHLIVTERVPLEFVIQMLFELEAPNLIIEWVSPDDPRFLQISQTHGDLYSHLTDAVFEQELKKRFLIVEQMPLPNKTRTLYFCTRL